MTASDDKTGAEIKALFSTYPDLRYVKHGQRAGQSAALRTGRAGGPLPGHRHDGRRRSERPQGHHASLRAARSARAGAGAGRWFAGFRKDTGSKKFASRFANWLRDKVLDDGCPDTGCGIKAYHRDAYLELPYFTSMHRYLPAFFLTYGHDVVYEPVNDRPRLRGASKYTNLGRALIGIYDLVGVSWLRKRTHIPPVVDRASSRRAGAFRGGRDGT